MRRSSRSPRGSAARLGGTLVLERRGVDPGEEVEETRQRVEGHRAVGVVLAAVPDEVEGGLALLVGDLREGEDLRGVHDRRVEPGLDGLVQEHGVEDHPRSRVEAEGDVRDAERRVHPGVLRLERADRLDGLDGVAAGLLLSRGDREGEGVDDDVGDVHAPAAGEVVDEAARDRELGLGGARLALFVDGERDDRRPVLLDERHDAPVARGLAVAVLEVHRVDDPATADEPRDPPG